MSYTPNGALIYSGPSILDGKPIIAIVTGLRGKSANGKTGDMLQTWILRADVSPLDAIRTGADESICGDCKHRPANLGTCYVSVFQAPRAVYDGFKRGIYPSRSPLGLGLRRAVRLGSSAEANFKLTCQTCGACNGTATQRRGHVAIIVHGAKHARF